MGNEGTNRRSESGLDHEHEVHASARGRPRIQETADDIVASILATGGPRVSSPGFSTRGISELTGLSQTVVSRAMRRLRHTHALPPDSAPALQVQSCVVEHPRIRLTFTSLSDGNQMPESLAGGHRRAAAVVAALWVSGAAAWRATEDYGPPLGSERVPAVPEEETLTMEWAPGLLPWETALERAAVLLHRCAHSQAAIPPDLLRLLASRAGHGLHGITWHRNAQTPDSAPISDSDSLSVAEFPAPGRSAGSRWLPNTALSTTEQIAVTLRKVMTSAGYRVGDRIVPAQFAARLRLSESAVRAAMRQLADDGLLERTGTGFAIPQVSGADVIDLYASRLQVGTVILRGCAGQPRHRLLAARMALGALEAAARQGNRADVGEADLRFQQELADASGLPQSARSFHALTLRLRMFISVLQLDYGPAVERLVADDRRLLAAVLRGQPADAVGIWRSKLDDAVRHMSALAPDTFDPGLWSRLTR